MNLLPMRAINPASILAGQADVMFEAGCTSGILFGLYLSSDPYSLSSTSLLIETEVTENE
jgi:hypothetical protein